MNLFKLVASDNRHLNYLRISITDRCNLRCVYCTPYGCVPKLKHYNILTYEEILRLVKIGVSLGITKVRITGGEPLVRKGIYSFIRQLSEVKGLNDLSLTTNGVLLLENANRIKKAGIKRINISLDSLNREKYQNITNYDEFKRVWGGIIHAHSIGFYPIKLNIVVMKGVNDNEICEFAKLTFKYPFHIRFIEYMPMGLNQIKSKYQILTPEIKEKLFPLGFLKPIKNEKNDGPARRFKFDGAVGELGFISAISHNFCHKCNRLRLTADGCLRSCLLSNISFSLKELIKQGCSDYKISKTFKEAAHSKGSRHFINSNIKEIIKDHMYSIGG